MRSRLDTAWEAEAVRAVYARCSPADFSRDILMPGAASLAVLRVAGVVWSDLGDPARVLAIRQPTGEDALAAVAGR